jgi:hypothetical protein
LTTILIAQRQDTTTATHANLVALFKKIDRHFNDSELLDLCFQLNVDPEDFGDGGKRDKVRELVTYMDRHGRLSDLLKLASSLRPKVVWQDAPKQSDGVDIVARLNVAVVVDIARPTIKDVARYLDEMEISVNFVLLQHSQPNNLLRADHKWHDFIKAFSQTMAIIKHSLNGARIHFFLSAPGALIFGMGCSWGTVDEATVYHYEKGTYYPVIDVTRQLK